MNRCSCMANYRHVQRPWCCVYIDSTSADSIWVLGTPFRYCLTRVSGPEILVAAAVSFGATWKRDQTSPSPTSTSISFRELQWYLMTLCFTAVLGTCGAHNFILQWQFSILHFQVKFLNSKRFSYTSYRNELKNLADVSICLLCILHICVPALRFYMRGQK